MATNSLEEGDLAIEIVSDFLQSVVIVDDGADFDPSSHQALAGAPRAQKPSRFPRPRLKAPQHAAVGNENILDAKRVVDAFADRGIVCSILRPAEGEDPAGRTQKVTRRADMLVLDWDFYGDNGEAACRLLRDVLGDDVRDNRRRLIAIYTAEPNLDEILDRVREVLLQPKGRKVRNSGAYALDAGVARVVVYAKPESRIPREKRRARKQIVGYEQLAGVLIDQFADFMYGLVSNVALKSVAALRANTHQLLKQLGPELDAGYLWHRAVQVHPRDAEQHLVDLVSAELRAILDDCEVREAASSRAMRQWLEKRCESDFGKRFGETQSRSVADVMDLLEFGSAAKTAQTERVVEKFPRMKSKAAHRKSDEIAAFAESKEKAKRSNEAFAVLASHRTQYSKPQPRLTLGTIISSGTGKRRRYWLCLQPVCDAVRLSGPRTFPFLELNAADGGGFQFVLQGHGRASVRLRIEVKPQNLTMLEFQPKGGSDCVTAEPRSWQFFFSRGKRRYRWEAELKREHAQRFAERLANEFSKIGLVESEWLRLWGGEKKPEPKLEKAVQAISV